MSLLSWIFPPSCARCLLPLPNDSLRLCASCHADLAQITLECCPICGAPHDAIECRDLERDDPCTRCAEDPPPFAIARAPWRYEACAKDLISRIKYAGDLATVDDIAHLMAPWFDAQLAEWCDPNDTVLVVPVPMHRRALVSRGFNLPSVLLDRLIPKLCTPCTILPGHDVLAKPKRTLKQASLARAMRAANALDSFEIADDPPRADLIIVLDDVMTTGATARAACEVLLGHTPRSPHVVTIARAI